MKIAAIQIGERVRKDMGDLAGLAASMERLGMLEPVVVTKEGVLVAGLRRIEAAKILKWPDVPTTVVSLDDLLSAERDENTIRKDFTPTEAVAIGHLIEMEHKKKIAAIRPQQMSAAGKRSAALRSGTSTKTEMEVPSVGGAEEVAAKAVGMTVPRYFYAKKVVAAAEAEPEKYGDLPGRMDETRNVSGTYREMRRRKDSTTGRHPVHYKKHYPKTNQMIRRAIDSLEGICSGFSEIKAEEADATEAPAWAKSLDESASAIRSFAKRLKNVKAGE